MSHDRNPMRIGPERQSRDLDNDHDLDDGFAGPRGWLSHADSRASISDGALGLDAPSGAIQPGLVSVLPVDELSPDGALSASEGPSHVSDIDGIGLDQVAPAAGFGDDPNLTIHQDSRAPTLVDSDGDGLYDYLEGSLYRTDPRDPDTDGDGITDGDEVRNGTDPLSGSGPGTGTGTGAGQGAGGGDSTTFEGVAAQAGPVDSVVAATGVQETGIIIVGGIGASEAISVPEPVNEAYDPPADFAIIQFDTIDLVDPPSASYLDPIDDTQLHLSDTQELADTGPALADFAFDA
jgi:Bacterial TSP3 repeat